MNPPLVALEGRKLSLTTDSETFDFPLPDPSDYPQDHILVIPFVGYFVRLRMNGEWELSDMIPQIV